MGCASSSSGQPLITTAKSDILKAATHVVTDVKHSTTEAVQGDDQIEGFDG